MRNESDFSMGTNEYLQCNVSTLSTCRGGHTGEVMIKTYNVTVHVFQELKDSTVSLSPDTALMRV